MCARMKKYSTTDWFNQRHYPYLQQLASHRQIFQAARFETVARTTCWLTWQRVNGRRAHPNASVEHRLYCLGNAILQTILNGCGADQIHFSGNFHFLLERTTLTLETKAIRKQELGVQRAFRNVGALVRTLQTNINSYAKNTTRAC